MKYLEQSVQSVLNQDLHSFEFLICDDCSKDLSWEYLKLIKDDRVTVFRNEKNKGLFATLNFLCKSTDADIIKLWSQDDIMNINCLSETVKFHEKYKDIAFSYSDRIHIDDKDEVIRSNDYIDYTPEFIPKKLHDKIALFTGSIAGNISNVAIINKKVKEVGYFDESMTICADFDMWVKLSANNDIGKIKKPLILLRDHDGQLSRSPSYYLRHLKEDKKVFNALMARASDEMKVFGIKNLRRRKLPLYFSFFLQTVKRRDWQLAKAFISELSKQDNIILLALRWTYLKCTTPFLKKQRDNSFLFKTSGK